MALFKTKETYKPWRVKNFPNQIKEKFKNVCKEKKVNMVGVMRKLARDYINETAEMYKNKILVEVNKKEWGKRSVKDTSALAFSSFPVKLLADFKSCCNARGELLTDVTINLIKKYVGESN